MNFRYSSHPIAGAALSVAMAAGCGDGVTTPSAPSESPDSGLATSSACSSDVRYVAPGDTAEGSSGVLRAVLLNAAPPASAMFLNVWTLEVQTADGTVAADAEITRIETFMPVHGHPGLPAATAAPASEPGSYRAELYFTMRGPWQVRLDVASPVGGSDHFVFDVCVGG